MRTKINDKKKENFEKQEFGPSLHYFYLICKQFCKP